MVSNFVIKFYQARILYLESLQGYPQHKWLCIGYLAELADAAVEAGMVDIANRLRDMRLTIVNGDVPNFDSMVMELNRVTLPNIVLGLEVRKGCYDCCKKHLSQAAVNLLKNNLEYALAHLYEAEAEDTDLPEDLRILIDDTIAKARKEQLTPQDLFDAIDFIEALEKNTNKEGVE